MSLVLPPVSIVEVELAVQGMTCGACAAKIEKELNEITGIEAAVNYATETAMVAFDADVMTQAAVISAVERIGYSARVMDDQPFDDDLDARLRAAAIRLGVSVAFTIPVVLLSMVMAWQFHNWQWWAMGLSAPVVTWGAWPFHKTAFRNAMHGSSTMDTLISVGVIAATAWSIWAVVWGEAIACTLKLARRLPHSFWLVAIWKCGQSIQQGMHCGRCWLWALSTPQFYAMVLRCQYLHLLCVKATWLLCDLAKRLQRMELLLKVLPALI
jgi:cation transport ATPase